VIKIQGISKNFQDIEALQNVNLTVNQGSIFGLIGSNGAGKTTLLKILAGIYRQNSGEVRINEEPIFENNRIKARMVFIPDHPHFFSNYTIEDMAGFYRRVYPCWDQERWIKLSEVFGLDVRRRTGTLSKGQQRQIAFWLALSVVPDIMLLDEPLDGLDPVMRQKAKNLVFQEVAERRLTVVISSHNLRELEDFCDCVGILHHGKALLQKDLDDLKADLHKVQIAFSGEVAPALFQESQILRTEKRGSVLTLIMRGPSEEIVQRLQSYHPAILDILPLTLEEVFIYEMGENGYEIHDILN